MGIARQHSLNTYESVTVHGVIATFTRDASGSLTNNSTSAFAD